MSKGLWGPVTRVKHISIYFSSKENRDTLVPLLSAVAVEFQSPCMHFILLVLLVLHGCGSTALRLRLGPSLPCPTHPVLPRPRVFRSVPPTPFHTIPTLLCESVQLQLKRLSREHLPRTNGDAAKWARECGGGEEGREPHGLT